MLDSVKNKIQKSGLIALLAHIVAGTQSPAGYAFVPKVEGEKLAKAEPSFITLDFNVTGPDGQIKAVATSIAIEALHQHHNPSPVAKPAEAETNPSMTTSPYQIVTLTEIPAIQRGGHKAEVYPFDQLAVFPAADNSFFVPSTEKKPKPSKSLASTVASATKRYVGKGDRVFTIRKHVVDGVEVGAHVIRTK